MEFDKTKVLENVISSIEANLEKVQESYNTNNKSANEASSAMISRYDTFREEAGWVANSLGKRANSLADELRLVKAVDATKTYDHARVGAIVEIEDQDSGNCMNYFLLPGGGGTKVNVDSILYSVITPSSPLAKAMIGKKVDDEFEFGHNGKKREYAILDIK